MLKMKLANGEEVSVKPKSYFTMSLKDGSFAYIPKIVNHIEEKAFNSIAITQFEGIYDDISYYPEKPGCIMMDVTPLSVLEHVENAEDDIVEETDMDYSPVPGEDVSHVTLLYGLLENGNKWKNKVDALLNGSSSKEKWSMSEVEIDTVDYFDIGDSYAIIAKLVITPELEDAHGRLSMLPNAQTFSQYLPHITLAYIKKDADVKKWVDSLGEIYNGEVIATTSINYGDKEEDDDEEENKKTNRLDSTNGSRESDEKNKGSEEVSEIGHIHHDEEVTIREDIIKANNALSDETNNLISQQQGALQNSVQNIENQMVTSMLSKIMKAKNKFDDQKEIMSSTEKAQFINEMKMIISAYYISLFPIYGNQMSRKRSTEFNVQVPFQMNKAVHDYITITARRASQSHVNTIVDDILTTAKKTYEESFRAIEEQLRESGHYSDSEIYKLAGQKALEGASQQNIINAIKKKYQDISQTRAKTIARTETNRAFTQSQFQADLQFLNSAGLMEKAYKQWQTRSDNPCQYCLDLEARGPIPFNENFQDLGTEISSVFYKKDGTPVVRKLQINYEELTSGNAHVNCQCRYVLVIKSENGEFINHFLDIEENAGKGNPNHDDLGRFSTGSGSYATMTPVEFEASAIRDYGSQVEWTDKQKTAIDFYTGMYYREINAHLNGKHVDSTKNFEFPTNESGIKTLDEGVKVLDSSMKNTLKKNTDLYRGYTTKYDLTPGMELRYKGYSSTSFFPSVGEKFAKENAKYKFDDAYRPVVLKIKAKKGQKGIIPITEGSDLGLRGVEAEFILPRDTTIKINKITDKGDYEEAEVSIL